jgi:hypothetical protein
MGVMLHFTQQRERHQAATNGEKWQRILSYILDETTFGNDY